MEVKDLSKEGKGDVLEVFMVHKVFIGKKDPIASFKDYLSEILKEFEHEIARTVYPQLVPTRSHILVPD